MNLREKYGGDLSESQAKKEMKEAGIPVVKTFLAENKIEAEKHAEETGLPAVLKIDSEEIKHKTDIGAIKKAYTMEQVREKYDEILGNVKKNMEDADINGVIVEEEVGGNEFIAGVNQDPQFGKVLMFGLGGVHVEVFEDVVFRPLPVTEQDIRDMIEETESKKLLEGVRGGEKTDKDFLVEVLKKIAEFGEKEEIRELDVNPLFIEGNDIKVADALVRLEG